MGRLSRSLIALLLGAAATVLLSSCGGSGNSGLLPGATASQINSNLDKIPELVAAGECAGARNASAEISGQIEALEGVNGRLKEALSEGAARLDELVSTCQEVPDAEAEELEGVEAAEEAQAEQEAGEKKEKPEKQGKPENEKGKEKEEQQAEPPEEQDEQDEQETAPPAEGGGTPSGGIGPGAPAGGE